jgi:ABC-type transport system involved in cytochrome bd biosynthesis fused ATPase/permease subunit
MYLQYQDSILFVVLVITITVISAATNDIDVNRMAKRISKSIQQSLLTGLMGDALSLGGHYEYDAKTAELRESLLRSKESNITRHQVVFLGRPLRPSSIPYLWALSVLFIGASILMFQTMTPPLQPLFTTLFGTSTGMGDGVGGGFLSDVRVWRTLVGAFTVVIIFLSLRVANVI